MKIIFYSVYNHIKSIFTTKIIIKTLILIIMATNYNCPIQKSVSFQIRIVSNYLGLDQIRPITVIPSQLLSCDPSAWCEIGSQFSFRFSTQPCYIWHSKFATYREASGVRLDSQQLQFTAEPRTGTSRARHARVRV